MPPKEIRGPQSGAASPTFEPYKMVSVPSVRSDSKGFRPSSQMPVVIPEELISGLVAGEKNWSDVPPELQTQQAAVEEIVKAYPAIVFYKDFPATDVAYLKIVEKHVIANGDRLDLAITLLKIMKKNPNMLEAIEGNLFCQLVVKVYGNSEHFQIVLESLVHPFFEISADTASDEHKQKFEEIIANPQMVGYLMSVCTVPVKKLYQFYSAKNENDGELLRAINAEFVHYSKITAKDASWNQKFEENYCAFLTESVNTFEPYDFEADGDKGTFFATLLFEFLPKYVFLTFFSLPVFCLLYTSDAADE